MREITVQLMSIEDDGMPDMSKLAGRVALISGNNVVSGWPLYPDYSNDKSRWEGNSGIGSNPFRNVSHYLVFEKSVLEYER